VKRDLVVETVYGASSGTQSKGVKGRSTFDGKYLQERGTFFFLSPYAFPPKGALGYEAEREKLFVFGVYTPFPR